MRFRLGDENKPRPSGPDCLNTDDVDHVILDHITATWGIDGNHDLRRGGNFTLQWSIYAEALNDSLHEKGTHAMLASFRDLTASISIHHNLLASSRERHPTLGGSPRTKPEAIIDFRNNVVYNPAGATNLGQLPNQRHQQRVSTGTEYARRTPFRLPPRPRTSAPLRVFLSGNTFTGNRDPHRRQRSGDRRHSLDQRQLPDGEAGDILSTQEFDVGDALPRTDSAAVAYDRILQQAGASRRRDAADSELVEGVRQGTHRMINSQREVGGWPVLKSQPAPPDQDRDGMADAWEQTHGLDAGQANDRNADRDGDGYTNLEEYLNGLK